MPKVDRWARLTVRLPAATYRRLEALAEEIPGMTPNALIRLAVEQLTPQLEAMAHALKVARSGQQGDALELLVALTQASRGPVPAVLAEAAGEAGQSPGARSVPEALAQVQALQREQRQRVEEELDRPQERGLRAALGRVQALQREQIERVQELLEQPQDDLVGALEWVQALHQEQERWLQKTLAHPHEPRLLSALERVQALQREQGQHLDEALGQAQAPPGRDDERGANQTRDDAAASFHQRWLDAGAGAQGSPPRETDGA